MSKHSDQQILNLLFSYPILFDSTRPEFKDKTIREHLWIAISKQIGCDAAECKERLRAIRARHNVEIEAKTSVGRLNQDTLLKSRACAILNQCPELLTSSSLPTSQYMPLPLPFYPQSICEQSLNADQRWTPSSHSNESNSSLKSSLMLQCGICPEVLRDEASLSRHLSTHSPLRCRICQSSFTHSRYLDDHMRCHQSEQDFQHKPSMPHCTAGPNKSPLERHKMNPTHKQFRCQICERAFTQSSNLKTHMKIHSGERPFQCPVCAKAFAQSSNMKSHLKTHTGERPYECALCPRAFTQSSNLKEHVKTHTGERPFQCTLCERAFTQLSNLKEHIKIHTGERPHECPVCKKHFTQAANLKDHVKTHTDERDYACATCDKRFIQMSALRSHEKIHSGERPFRCSLCEKAFVQASNLRQHFRTHHELGAGGVGGGSGVHKMGGHSVGCGVEDGVASGSTDE